MAKELMKKKIELEHVQFLRFFPVAYPDSLCPIQWGGRFVRAA